MAVEHILMYLYKHGVYLILVRITVLWLYVMWRFIVVYSYRYMGRLCQINFTVTPILISSPFPSLTPVQSTELPFFPFTPFCVLAFRY